jgi:hypothetical protein
MDYHYYYYYPTTRQVVPFSFAQPHLLSQLSPWQPAQNRMHHRHPRLQLQCQCPLGANPWAQIAHQVLMIQMQLTAEAHGGSLQGKNKSHVNNPQTSCGTGASFISERSRLPAGDSPHCCSRCTSRQDLTVAPCKARVVVPLPVALAAPKIALLLLERASTLGRGPQTLHISQLGKVSDATSIRAPGARPHPFIWFKPTFCTDFGTVPTFTEVSSNIFH